MRSASDHQDPIAAAVTTSVSRRLIQGREREFIDWTDAGISLVRTYPGFLGGGWFRSPSDPGEFHVLFQFDDNDSRQTWLASPLRRAWMQRGTTMTHHEKTRSLSGIEGWFDAPKSSTPPRTDPAPKPPPRWKQMSLIWTGYTTLSLVLNYCLIPHLHNWPIAFKVLAMTTLTTPTMVYLMLPFATRKLHRWLYRD